MGPIAATRCPRENTRIGKYDVKAGTVIFPNLYSMTQDPKLWGQDVNEFNPDRFLHNGVFKNDWWDFTFGTGNIDSFPCLFLASRLKPRFLKFEN